MVLEIKNIILSKVFLTQKGKYGVYSLIYGYQLLSQ